MVHFNVPFSRFNSFVDITVVLAKTLFDRGVPVSIHPSKIVPNNSDVLSKAEKNFIQYCMEQPISELFEIRWSHYWYGSWKRQMAGHVNLEFFAINYEFMQHQEAFDPWMQDAISNPYHKIAISQFCKQVLMQAGCPESKISVVPLGFNPLLSKISVEKISTQLNSPVKYILHLTNSFDLYRFGTDILMEAFCQEFQGEQTVELIIKDGGAHPELITDQIKKIAEKFGKKMPRMMVTARFLSKEELARLYLCVDALVTPFRGEGFAIKVLDGFAAGLPIAMPLYGGPTEYANPSNCYPIDYQVVPVKECYDTQNLELKNAPHWAEPDLLSLRKQLRNIIADPNRDQVAKRAKETAQQFSWDATASQLLTLMRQLC